jgi:hypothetical protein
MNVEIGAEASLFPEKEYISGIFVGVHEYVERPKPTSLIIFIYFSAMWEGTPLDEVLNSSIEKNIM